MRNETKKILEMRFTTDAERQQILICNEQRTQQLEQEQEKLQDGRFIYRDDPRWPEDSIINTELYWLGVQKRRYLKVQS